MLTGLTCVALKQMPGLQVCLITTVIVTEVGVFVLLYYSTLRPSPPKGEHRAVCKSQIVRPSLLLPPLEMAILGLNRARLRRARELQDVGQLISAMIPSLFEDAHD